MPRIQRLEALRRDGTTIVWVYAPGVIEGGRIDANQAIVTIDRRDYELAVETANATASGAAVL